MVYELLSNRNMSQGFHVIFQYVNDVTSGLFVNLLLFAVWMIFTVSLYNRAKYERGEGDLPSSMAVASFITLITTILFRLIPGMIGDWTFGIVIAVFILSLMYLFFSDNDKQ